MNDIVAAPETGVLHAHDPMPAEITPTTMLASAVAGNQDLERIEKLMDLERAWKVDKAREQFYLALSEFKKVNLVIVKDKANVQYNSRYVSVGNLVNTASRAMAPFGLNTRWDISQDDEISVTCILSHTGGHTEQVTMSGPPDESGKKNSLQQIKSTVTYLETSTFEAVTGIISQDHSDDGNGAGPQVETITDNQAADLAAMIDEVGADKAGFLGFLKVDAIEDLPAVKYKAAVRALENKRSAQ